ncbi:MAG TPA: PIN domain-containing protein [Hyphomicrobiaceae bacterium]
MRPHALIDSGAIIGLLDTSDRWHDACARAFRSMGHPLATTTAALTEVFHHQSGSPHRLQTAWGLVRSRSIAVLPIGDNDLPELERLMLKYADRPMDFADATLVRLAEREGLTTILTVDRDFEVYRIGGRRAFRVLPKR